jgi:hypothetical protein
MCHVGESCRKTLEVLHIIIAIVGVLDKCQCSD